ncbi:hypothetical protein K3495_g5150 [Podosphaera aphanis]|nr:hypothetical protein K3495_g5150 [Podosphaera aphanis]
MSPRPLQPLPPIQIIHDPPALLDHPKTPWDSFIFDRSSYITAAPRMLDFRLSDDLPHTLQASEPATIAHGSNIRENSNWELPENTRPENWKTQLSEVNREISPSLVSSVVESPVPMSSTFMRLDDAHSNTRIRSDTVCSDRIIDPKVANCYEAYSSRFQFHDKYRTASHAYDKEILSKLDVRRKNNTITPPQGSARPQFSLSSQEVSPSQISLEHRSKLERLFVPVSSPTCKVTHADGPSNQWPEVPLSHSPSNLYPGRVDRKSPTDVTDSGRLSISPNFNRLGNDYLFGNEFLSLPGRPPDGPDQRVSQGHDDDLRNETGLRRLKIDEYNFQSDSQTSSNPGKKRKASSSPEDDALSPHICMSPCDLHQRRESTTSRSSIGPRLHSQSGSISSTESSSRTNSYASNFSLTPSSITSMGSVFSPTGISPGGFDVNESPCTTYLLSNPSLQGTRSRPSHLENSSSENRAFFVPVPYSSDSNIPNQPSGLVPAFQGVYVCDCCPKKPKRFGTREDLHAHEQEKQYECLYCRNRFKNKNEAERHQNSLHLRRHSWSCAALTEYSAAFHSSPNQLNETDACGYCGEEFPRSGINSGTFFATEKDWDVRINHLIEIHKFGECNHTKKFFRADHFRQHLKHSHAGTSGKWTNMLENACIKDELLPEPIRRPERIGPGGPLLGREREKFM